MTWATGRMTTWTIPTGHSSQMNPGNFPGFFIPAPEGGLLPTGCIEQLVGQGDIDLEHAGLYAPGFPVAAGGGDGEKLYKWSATPAPVSAVARRR